MWYHIYMYYDITRARQQDMSGIRKHFAKSSIKKHFATDVYANMIPNISTKI